MCVRVFERSRHKGYLMMINFSLSGLVLFTATIYPLINDSQEPIDFLETY